MPRAFYAAPAPSLRTAACPTRRPATRPSPATRQRAPVQQRRRAITAMSASPRAPPACLIFDLDGTLYPNDNGYVAHIRQNAERYMTEQLGIPADEVSAVRRQALALANQTVRGLKMQG